MRTRTPVTVTALLAAGILLGWMAPDLHAQDQAATPTVEKIREEQAYTLGTAAFLWGFTMNELYRVRSAHVDKQGAALNAFVHNREVTTPEIARKMGVVRPNSATLYSLAWLDLSIEPIVLEFPSIPDHYFTFNYVDWFQKIENLSNTTVGRAGGAYAFVGPRWKGALPAGMHRVDVASDTVWIIARIEVKGPADVKYAHATQDKYSLTALRQFAAGKRNTVGNNAYEKWPAYDVSEPLNWFALLNEGLRRNPPQGGDLAMLGLFETLNIGPNKTFDAGKLDPATRSGLRRALAIGPHILAEDFKARLGQSINGWQVTKDLGSWLTPDTYQLDFLRRSAIAKEGQPGQASSEAMYPIAYVDADGQPLTGANRYVLRFAKGQLPPANAFWSLTMYDADGYPIDNPVNRNQIGTYDRLAQDADGAVTITIQHASPGKDREGNWLPAPAGSFNVVLRLYNPAPAARNLDWVPPAVRKVQ
jgi:hypothetical protein